MERLSVEFIEKHIPKLGFGLMRLPKYDSEDKNINIEVVQKMVDLCMSNGFNYFDTAYFYHKGYSEQAFKSTVSNKYPRDSYFVADKLPIWLIESPEDNSRIFNEQLERCGVDYFDFYLLHALNKDNYNKCIQMDAFDFCRKMKQEGKIKYFGFSFHDKPEVLEEILNAQPDMEFVQLQINYLDWYNETRSDEYYRIAREHNLPIIVMEPVKGGTLASLPEKAAKRFEEADPKASMASWAIRYCASLEGVMTVLSGMSNMEQLEDNLSYMKKFTPMNQQELEAVKFSAQTIIELSTVPCTACKYCDKCPVGIDIPGHFTIVNEYKKNNDLNKAKTAFAAYEEACKADKCIQCGLCEGVCPQQISIIERLRDISQRFVG